ncbi:hypothetical protein [Flavobacterium ginsenosidimutans]|uniref:hypothetical protein n=1 Tax=Flavobacterium ginsenosidimutans TaxID=687844 RepID=UPI000DAD978A|nr:hypothetical protein [Flavobacterium ginsenosidimutans]KAF2330365.1 hypothetical protein DM444_13535 [Flavobacterium ginsenosidimutans]
MFELYKKRQLGDNLGDTFTFFKDFGKNFFKIFFIVNGAFLVLFGIMIYTLIEVNFEAIKNSGFGNQQLKSDLLEHFNNNEALTVLLIFISVLLFLILSLFNYAYPVLYLKMLGTGKKDFELNDVLSNFFKVLFKLIKFSFGFLFIVFPVLLIALIIMFLLCFIIIGIPLLIIALPTCFTFLNLWFYSYLTEEKRFFESLKHAIYLVKKDFWNTIGTTFIMMIIMQFVQTAITMFFYFVGLFISLAYFIGNSDSNSTKALEPSPLLIGFITIIVIVLIILGNIFNNAIIINQGMVYYSLESENKLESESIDLIGDHTNE